MTTEKSDMAQRFSSTPRGARLARRLAQAQLAFWGVPFGCELSDDVGLVVGELAANAVLHGRVAGRDFELRLEYGGGNVRVMVSDTRSDKGPPDAPAPVDPWSAEDGRGLMVVAAVAREWGVVARGPGKTVWAQVGDTSSVRRQDGAGPKGVVRVPQEAGLGAAFGASSGSSGKGSSAGGLG
ncbi:MULTISPECIES: ATP-binding protein [unclassified Streptomyces]|uniref:ATP-binding protein n=1 Tax=unclassified Streptomyces TaxID=2593676 RepID=UPI002B1D904F|nr:ATP-binding protein [Streptomyces sp. NBC_00047]